MQHATPPVTTRQVSVTEAARELGISTETVRRRIKSGDLPAERAIRPQGTVWLVSLPLTTPRGVPPVTGHGGHTEASLSKPEHATPAEAWQATPPVTGRMTDAAPLVASIARLIAELAEVRVISDRRADQLVGQAELIGLLRAENAALSALQRPQAGSEAPAPPEPTPEPPPSPEPLPRPNPPRPHWRALAPWLLAVLAARRRGRDGAHGAAGVSLGLQDIQWIAWLVVAVALLGR